jgi:hypothetical protein
MQPYKLYRFHYRRPLEEVKQLLEKVQPRPEVSPIFGASEGDVSNVRYIELRRAFTDLRYVDRDLWGCMKYEVLLNLQDINGEIKDERTTLKVDFVMVHGDLPFVVILAKSRGADTVAKTMNGLVSTNVPLVRKLSLTGVQIEKFLKANPFKSRQEFIPVSVPGWNTISAAGPDVRSPGEYEMIKELASDERISSVFVLLEEYRWMVRLNKNGTIQCYHTTKASDFLQFLKDKVFPLYPEN